MTIRDALSVHRVPSALLSATVIGLAARLLALGDRVFYYDEAWFGYWVLRGMEHGAWEYRPILHGPLFARVNSLVFGVVGATDATARLVVALTGALLPLAAWLFRTRLRDAELIALGAALACNPVLVYYSRFMRKDLPLAACMLLTLGLLVRASDTRRPRYLYASAVTLGVAFATKESVLLWMVTWLGASVLVLDRHLLRARDTDGDALGALRSLLRRAVAGARDWWHHGVLAAAVFLSVVVYFYAPRAGPGQEIGLWRALTGDFATLPAVVGEATLGSLHKAIDYWATGSIQRHAYLPYFTDTADTVIAGASGVAAFAVVGFLWDRYAGAHPRGLVAFNFYCGVAALVGYPLANNFPVPWSTVHAIVPLTVPAAVGAAVVYRWGRSRLPAREPTILSEHTPMHAVRAVLAAAVLLSAVAAGGATLTETSYQAPHESPRGDPGSDVIYYAQAPADLRTVVTDIERAAASGGSDTDVLYAGAPLAMTESRVDRPPATGAWHARMPLPWYTESLDADVASVDDPTAVGDTPPPVVITTPALESQVGAAIGAGYERETHALDDIGDRTVVVFTATTE
ncbi:MULTISPECIES: flippase activity-associated protein Agl23 [Halobacterium]|uniref:flippase activity-associated protein Agl23 n=1 Tax=Halobacterium TaxID=2239 RepID=UPI001964A36C|nr:MULTISPECIES: flippase activity-associated protein Agl23 [Halobacterium]MDL0127203.1 TIGR03663 family protein [Halobacterium salinarum]MDL0133286.1 TIGR03663 family protein [Halobacterium salinarum]QRY24426.1 TIGR03663 family protein [Halobacterium sp. BOL4-2]